MPSRCSLLPSWARSAPGQPASQPRLSCNPLAGNTHRGQGLEVRQALLVAPLLHVGCRRQHLARRSSSDASPSRAWYSVSQLGSVGNTIGRRSTTHAATTRLAAGASTARALLSSQPQLRALPRPDPSRCTSLAAERAERIVERAAVAKRDGNVASGPLPVTPRNGERAVLPCRNRWIALGDATGGGS